MNTVRPPQMVDELMQIWFFEADQALFIVAGLFIGTAIDSMFLCTVAGIIGASIFGKFKEGKNRGMLFHFVYWYVGIPMKSLWCDIAFKKHWIK